MRKHNIIQTGKSIIHCINWCSSLPTSIASCSQYNGDISLYITYIMLIYHCISHIHIMLIFKLIYLDGWGDYTLILSTHNLYFIIVDLSVGILSLVNDFLMLWDLLLHKFYLAMLQVLLLIILGIFFKSFNF